MKHVLKIIFFVCLSLCFSEIMVAQSVGINSTGNAPDPSAMLDVSSSNSGMLIPRLSQTQRNAIDDPATGLMIYQTDYVPGFYYYDGTDWIPLKKDIKAMGTFTSWGGGSGVPAYSNITLISDFKYNLSHTNFNSDITISYTGIYEIFYQIEAITFNNATVAITINGNVNGFSISKFDSDNKALGSTIVYLSSGDIISLKNMSSESILIEGFGLRLTVKKID